MDDSVLSSIELVIFDLDGTLIDTNLKFKANDLKSISMLMEKGIKVTIATGRTFGSALPYIRMLSINMPVITCNGAAIVDSKTEKLILEKRISAEIIQEAVHTAQYFHVEPILYKDSLRSDPYIVKETNTVTAFIKQEGLKRVITGSIKEVTDTSMQAVKLQIVGVAARLVSYKKEILSKVKNINIVMTKPDYLEIMPAGVSKGSAAEHLCGILNIPREKTMSFGDSLNDFELLTLGGIGVAMADAPEELKSSAEFITGDISSILKLLIADTGKEAQ